MGTILNTCKKARKKIAEVEKQMDEVVVAWEVLNSGEENALMWYENEQTEVLRRQANKLLGMLQAIDGELEKDSEVRAYYNGVYNKCVRLLDTIKA